MIKDVFKTIWASFKRLSWYWYLWPLSIVAMLGINIALVKPFFIVMWVLNLFLCLWILYFKEHNRREEDRKAEERLAKIYKELEQNMKDMKERRINIEKEQK